MRPLLPCTALFILCSCASLETEFSCPPVKKSANMALIDHGRHSSVALSNGFENGNKTMLRYSYGDWRYYALGRTGAVSGLRALLWPTQAGLGRKRLAGPIAEENIVSGLRVIVESVKLYEVDPGKLNELKEKLDRIYRNNINTKRYNQKYDLNFVHHPKAYSALNNSNHVVADWLEDLGCVPH